MADPSPVSPRRLEEIRQREQAATKGPWRCSDRGDGSASVYREEDALSAEALIDDARCPYIRGEVRAEDGIFIAHAREDIPYLLAALSSLTLQITHERSKVTTLQEDLARWEEREARICPEDVGFEEVIKKLRERAETAEQERDRACEKAAQHQTQMFEAFDQRDAATERAEALEQARARFTVQPPCDVRDGIAPVETTHACLYTRVRPCKELYPNDTDHWCGYCSGHTSGLVKLKDEPKTATDGK